MDVVPPLLDERYVLNWLAHISLESASLFWKSRFAPSLLGTFKGNILLV
jgi:hypothetical protein